MERQLACIQHGIVILGFLGKIGVERESLGRCAHLVHAKAVIDRIRLPVHAQFHAAVDVQRRVNLEIGRFNLVGDECVELIQQDGVLALGEPGRKSAAASDGNVVEVEALGEYVAHLLQIAAAAGKLETEDVNVVPGLFRGESAGHAVPVLVSLACG